MKVAKFALGNMQTNCYFLIDEKSDKCAVVDPADEFEKIMEKLTARQLTVEFILLTHGHFDHILALEKLREYTKAPVCIHAEDNEMLLDVNKSLLTYAGINKPFKPAEHLLSDGDEIRLGETTIKVMHTPGHTKGSVCYIAENNIISGDTLFRENIGRYDFYGGSYSEITKSLRKITELEGDYKIYPGHGPSTTLSHEKEYNFYLK